MCFRIWSWYPKELCELHNYYPLAPDKIEIKKDMFPNCQLKILKIITIGNVKKLMPNFFDEEKYMLHHENFQYF